MKVEPSFTLLYPSAGCEPTRPLSEKEVRQIKQRQLKAIQKHWAHEGVQAVIELLDMETAIAQARACLPGATAHDGGQGFALARLNGEIQRLRWAKARIHAET